MTTTGKSAYMPYRGNAHRLKGASPLTPQYLERQSLIANLAYMHFGNRDHAIAFLNAHNASLGAKPLDLAGDSTEGYAAVHGEILRQAPRKAGAIPFDTAIIKEPLCQ
ncbi:hypothetical protein FHW96_002626 [Novosphingobium sp. SG751A]|uniref:hypothetical protein n=1 Tax=Novosphingobium sp. SG751A TaxID=2587000 RepID=UPI00155801EC|nr:hypothetical protein [Novosphingobium sp. SG751A]NOW46466.1 hypothetical protein [Novosphingobium sp. SG751A]